MNPQLTQELIGANSLAHPLRVHPLWLTNGIWLAKKDLFERGRLLEEPVLQYLFPDVGLCNLTDAQVASVLSPDRSYRFDRTEWQYTGFNKSIPSATLFLSHDGGKHGFRFVNTMLVTAFGIEVLYGPCESSVPLFNAVEHPTLVIAGLDPQHITMPRAIMVLMKEYKG